MKKNLLKTFLITSIAIISLMGCGSDKSDKAPSNKDILDAMDKVPTISTEISNNDNDSDEETKNENETNEDTTEEAGEVYYLSYDPYRDEYWKNLAKEYTAETGINVIVVTAAAGTYRATLMSELTKDTPPTLFHVSGVDCAGVNYTTLSDFKDYCYDMSKTDVYKELTSDAYALKEDDSVFSISYSIDTYGIIVNQSLLKKAGYSVDQIKSFDDLKTIAQDITARSAELGFSAFTSSGMETSSAWRFHTYLANHPLYFELNGSATTDIIKGTYLDNYRQIFDLSINNSTCAPHVLADKTTDDSRTEFLNKNAVFYYGGSWEYGMLTDTFSNDDLSIIPIYIGAGNEPNQGLCTGSENYWCVNKNADPKDIKATLDFLYWIVTSKKGTETMANDLGFYIPYKNAASTDNLFVNSDRLNTSVGLKPITWNFVAIPSYSWKTGLGDALIAYAADQSDANWDAVVKKFVDAWNTEYQLLKDE